MGHGSHSLFSSRIHQPDGKSSARKASCEREGLAGDEAFFPFNARTVCSRSSIMAMSCSCHSYTTGVSYITKDRMRQRTFDMTVWVEVDARKIPSRRASPVHNADNSSRTLQQPYVGCCV